MKFFTRYFLKGIKPVVLLIILICIGRLFFGFIDSVGFNKIFDLIFGPKIIFLRYLFSLVLFLTIIVLIGIADHVVLKFLKWLRVKDVVKANFKKKLIKKFGMGDWVLIPFVSGVYLLGYFPKKYFPRINKILGKTVVPVFYPSTPAPFTGWTYLVELEKIIFTDLTIDEVWPIIVSGGMIGTSIEDESMVNNKAA